MDDPLPRVGAGGQHDQAALDHLRHRLAGRGVRHPNRAREVADGARAESDERAHDRAEARPVVGQAEVGVDLRDIAVEQLKNVPQARAQPEGQRFGVHAENYNSAVVFRAYELQSWPIILLFDRHP